jgi:hypothetical protein
MNKIYKRGTIVPNPKETMTVSWDKNNTENNLVPRGETKLENTAYVLKP